MGLKNAGGASFSLQRRLQPANLRRILACSSVERYSTLTERRPSGSGQTL